MKKLFIFVLISTKFVLSQTGPAGVGTSANNVFWLKADAGTSSTVDAVAISSWNDQSGNGINVSQSTASQQPSFATNVINGFPAIQFDNVATTNDKLIGADSPLLDNTAGYSFFMVSRPLNVDGNARVIVSKRTTVAVDQSFMQFYYTGNSFHTDIQTNNNRYNTAATFASNNNYLIDQLYDGSLAAASRCKTYVAGSLDVTSSEANTTVPDNPSPIVIGSTDATDTRPFGGYIAEVVIYRTALNDASRIIVDNYLSAKYNITLASNNKYVGDNVGNGNYDYEVSGVGRETSGSSPSFSASICGGLGISTTGVGLDVGDYILAGHATNTNSQVTTDVGGMTGTNNARWHRIWYVDITNTSTDIQANIEFDMSDGDVGVVALSTPTNYVLLYRATQTGNWTELATANAITGDRVQFNSYSFVNDGYYTIGSKNYLVSPLPIELLYFDAVLMNGKVDLKWATQSEMNNKLFTIERSKNAEQFEVLKQVRGQINSKVKRSYFETDEDPNAGVSYYRLKQTDEDGKVTYSKIVSVMNQKQIAGLKVYPNPSSGVFTVDLSPFSDGSIHIEIADESGRIVFAEEMEKSDDVETIELNVSGSLAKGTYMVTVTSNTQKLNSIVIIR